MLSLSCDTQCAFTVNDRIHLRPGIQEQLHHLCVTMACSLDQRVCLAPHGVRIVPGGKEKTHNAGAPYWFLSPFATIRAGDRVSVPFGRTELPAEGVVVKVEEADAQCAPYPMNRIKEIYEIL